MGDLIPTPYTALIQGIAFFEYSQAKALQTAEVGGITRLLRGNPSFLSKVRVDLAGDV
jgi:hypothetical protein